VAAAGPSRKQARRDAVFLLYQTEVTDLTMAELVEGQRLREGYSPDEFTIQAVAGVLKTRDDIDAQLVAHARDWPLDRIAPLERSILRLAVWEIQTGVTPPEVAIDEAGGFVNGVLGGIVRAEQDEAEQGDGDA
jgi:N utilization substance protein B